MVQTNLTIAVVALSFVAIATATATNDSVPGPIIGGRGRIITPKQYVFLGAIDGKMYLTDDSAYMTWEQAYQLCAKSNMQLATVDNTAQSQFLGQRLPYANRAYWVAGREQIQKQYNWERSSSMSLLQTGVFYPFDQSNAYRQCIAVDRGTGASSGYVRGQAVLCNAYNYVLCQI